MSIDCSWRPNSRHVDLISERRRRVFPRFAARLAAVVGIFTVTLLTTGCSHPATADPGMAVAFDGATGGVSLPLVTTATGNVTLESWVKIPTDARGCLVKIGDANTGYGFGVGTSHTSFDADKPGNALIGLYENSQWLYPTGDPTLSTDAWHHVAFVIGAAGTAPTFYIDGTAYAATPPGTPHDPANAAFIGGYPGANRWGNATMAKVAVYDSALSAERIKEHAGATSDGSYDAAVMADTPVAYYELNEANGPSAADSSGKSNTAAYVGNVKFSVPGPFASKQQPEQQPSEQPTGQ
jgi:trimeric autotransporter adhesin